MSRSRLGTAFFEVSLLQYQPLCPPEILTQCFTVHQTLTSTRQCQPLSCGRESYVDVEIDERCCTVDMMWDQMPNDQTLTYIQWEEERRDC